MGFFKKIFGDAADELKKNLEDAKNEMLSNLEEVKQDVKAGFINSTSNSRDDDEEDDEEPRILLGDFHDGVLTIREGITELDDESLEHYKRIRKIIFPASLERLDSNVIDEQLNFVSPMIVESPVTLKSEQVTVPSSRTPFLVEIFKGFVPQLIDVALKVSSVFSMRLSEFWKSMSLNLPPSI